MALIMGGCPGKGGRELRFDDIYMVPCPRCGTPVEFFRDEPVRPCHRCGSAVENPGFSGGCLEWCGKCRENFSRTTNRKNGNEKKDNHD